MHNPKTLIRLGMVVCIPNLKLDLYGFYNIFFCSSFVHTKNSLVYKKIFYTRYSYWLQYVSCLLWEFTFLYILHEVDTCTEVVKQPSLAYK